MKVAIMRYLKGTRLYAAWHRRRILKEVSAWDSADAAAAAFFGRFVEPGDLVFDVGANVGNRSKVFLSLGARVVAVEPQSFCVAQLRRLSAQGDLVVEHSAVGATPGMADLQVGAASTLSSLSSAWIERVKKSGRFGGVAWKGTERVAIVTLDSLIARHGVPVFVKLDVEGYELEALRGLSRQVKMLSFEFTPEFVDGWDGCIRRLAMLGFTRFNLSLGESWELHFGEWCDAASLRAELFRLSQNASVFGDVYASP